MPAEKQRALGNVFDEVSRDGRTITAADIDAYSIKYTGHRFFEHGTA